MPIGYDVPMTTIPLDTRIRILARYDKGKLTRAAVAEQFNVSEDFVKKLLKQRRRVGHVRPFARPGRTPTMTPERVETLRRALRADCGLTLGGMRELLGNVCTAACICYALARAGITHKKKRCGRPSRTARTCAGPAKNGRRWR